jgi:hypothetical protein
MWAVLSSDESTGIWPNLALAAAILSAVSSPTAVEASIAS